MRILITLLLVVATQVAAQMPDFGKATQLAEMKKIEWLVGEWKGQGTMQMGPNQSGTSNVVEKVERRLDGLALVVEGLGTIKGADGQDKVVHNALATISYDVANQRYRFLAQTQHGSFAQAEGKVENGAFIWTLKTGPNTSRYTISRNDKGQWIEIGERSADGTTWTKFFEMTLDRVK